MLALMTWHSDGSGDPSLYFFEESVARNIEPSIFRLIPKLVEEIEAAKAQFLGRLLKRYSLGFCDE